MVQARSTIGTWSDPELEHDILDRITPVLQIAVGLDEA